MKTLFILQVAFVLTNTVLGQTFYISNNPTFDSVSIVPANPTNNDSINFIIYISNEVQGRVFYKTLDSLGNQIYNTKISNDTIYIYEGSMEPWSDTTDKFIDTVKIGNIGSGQYHVLLINVLSSTMWPTPPLAYIDTSEFNLSVISSSGLDNFDYSEFINVFPIPSSDKLFISNNSNDRQIKNIILWDLSGRQVQKENFIHSHNSVDINISNLVSGLYFIKITTDDNSTYVGKIVKINEWQWSDKKNNERITSALMQAGGHSVFETLYLRIGIVAVDKWVARNPRLHKALKR